MSVQDVNKTAKEKHGPNITSEQENKILQDSQNNELSEGELSSIAGGNEFHRLIREHEEPFF